MNYEKIEEQANLINAVKIQESKYCEQIMGMLEILDEQDSMKFLDSIPTHLQEATLKKQVRNIYNRINEVLNFTYEIRAKLKKANTLNKNSSKYISVRDKNFILEKVRHIEELAEKTKAILDSSDFKNWYKDVDSNSNIFGGKKIGASGPSRKDLGV